MASAAVASSGGQRAKTAIAKSRYGEPKRFRRIDDLIRPQSQSWSLPGRSLVKVSIRSPGPAQYSARSSFVMPRQPSYSLRKRLQDPFDRASQFGPGPAAYSIDSNYVKTAAPQHSLAGRLGENSKFRSLGPGPAAYNTTSNSGHLKRAAAYSMKGRHHHRSHRAFVPGPGSYNINKSTFSKGPLVGIKLKKLKALGSNPGPAAYYPTKEKVLNSAPKFSFRPKYGELSNDHTHTPGPAHYGPPILPKEI